MTSISDLELSPEQLKELSEELQTRAKVAAEGILGMNEQAAKIALEAGRLKLNEVQEARRPSRLRRVIFDQSKDGWQCVEDSDTSNPCIGTGQSRDMAALDFDYNWMKPSIEEDGNGVWWIARFKPMNRLLKVPDGFSLTDNGQWEFLPISEQPIPDEVQPCGCTAKHLKEPDKERGTNEMYRRLNKCGGSKCVFDGTGRIKYTLLNPQVREGLEREGYSL